MRVVLVATIGTRDLVFRVSNGDWHNLGDDRAAPGGVLSQQAAVIQDLRLDQAITYRQLTSYLLAHSASYVERLQPVILGGLIRDYLDSFGRIYLVGTNQREEVAEREKDTLWACGLIKAWMEYYYPRVPVEIISLGEDGTNPANFEAMFYWWSRVWRQRVVLEPGRLLWVGLKGGVGQTSEASRVSGLSFYGEKIQFFEFHQDLGSDRTGATSRYAGPFLGTNYLWDRARQQALRLLDRYDYAGAQELLGSYFRVDPQGFGAVPRFLEGCVAWTQGGFGVFRELVEDGLSRAEAGQAQRWWWEAYEQAYLGKVRLLQKATTEALLHSCRAIEGLIYVWAEVKFPDYIIKQDRGYFVSIAICQIYPQLTSCFKDGQDSVLYPKLMQDLITSYLLDRGSTQDQELLDAYWSSVRDLRNKLSHCLGGTTEMEVFQAWGAEILNQEQWEIKITKCLNLIAGKRFSFLGQGSLLPRIHRQIKSMVDNYAPVQRIS